MQARITLELENKEAHKIKKLNLDDCVSSSIEGLTDDFHSLVKLSMNHVGLTSLENLPELESLKTLELSDNKISGGLKFLKSCPKLKNLNLSINEIKRFKELRPLRKLKKLKVLDLFNNDVQFIRNYREKVFYLIPSLKCLDGYDKSDREGSSDDDAELSYSEDEDSDEVTSNGEGDMEHDSEKSWDYDYFDDLPEEKKREIMKMNADSDNSSNSDSDSSDSSSSSSSSSAEHSDSSSWEDLSLGANSCDENSTKDNDTSNEEDWVDIPSDLSDETDEE